MTKAQPWQATSLWQYIDIVYKGFIGFSGPAWLQYDEEFRMRAAINPSLRWDQVHPQWWLQVRMPVHPNTGERSDSGHLVQRASAVQPIQPKLLCWEFSTQGVRSCKSCRYRHECPFCGSAHAFSACTHSKAKGGPKRNSGAGLCQS